MSLSNLELTRNYHRTMAKFIPRLLTQFERDPDSSIHGSFDRDFWHYKMRDFSSAILQQGMVSLDSLYQSQFEGNFFVSKFIG